jgi:hypothetical protein
MLNLLQCCTRDGGRSAGIDVQALVSNHFPVLRSKAVVPSGEKRGGYTLQVGIRELSKTESPLTRREVIIDVKTRQQPAVWDKSKGNLITDLDGIRRIGGRNLIWALVRNVGAFVRDAKGEIQVAETTRVRVPMREQGSDRSIVVMKPSKVGGAKGPDHSGFMKWPTTLVGGVDE